ncbi:carbohydrate ABC transporter permease [Halomonas sp. M4R1S46]|uniref:carbohydrate ABC transporter permease n=1 Tax=Halomonas sp. M4R1S46 TaxID=2982692 RepID=UPI0021E499D5|nr:carbohydrate ABC transporter permease [Halomonas sp. M4R1S46]UYG07475.1 carbohydrate ABC transporter permease [Halomonas sp. M4R1S46]
MTTARTKSLPTSHAAPLAQRAPRLGILHSRRLWLGVLGWSVALLIFFPIFWMVLTGFKTEAEAIAEPSLVFSPTLESYAEVQNRAGYAKFAINSVVVAFGSTLLALLIAIPAAYSMAFLPTRRTKGTLLWMLSTKMLPPVGVLVPIYLLFRDVGLLDTRTGLVIVYTLMNLPIVVWMLYTFFKDMPKDILEAGRMDGAGTLQEVLYLLLPLTLPGIASTGLLSVILSWNEAFWSLNLTSSQAAPLTAYIASFSSPEGLFWAKLSAASTMAIAPILVFGWLTQKQMVRGLTFGAVK